MRQRKPQRLADDLRRGRRAQKLAASAGRRTGAATHFSSIFERDLLLRKARADALHLGRILAGFGQQRDPTRNQHCGLRPQRRQRHHHRGQSLVAGRHAHHAFARGQRAHQPAQHRCRIVAIRQRVHHACRALRAAVAGIGARSRERRSAQRFQLPRGFGHQQAHLPVTGVKAQRNGFAVFRAQAAMRTQDQEFRIEQSRRLPPHAGILRQAEQVAGGLGEQHLR